MPLTANQIDKIRDYGESLRRLIEIMDELGVWRDRHCGASPCARKGDPAAECARISKAFDSAIRSYLPARARASQVRTILEQIDATVPGNDTGLAPVFHEIAERIPRRGLIIVLSDLFGDTAELLKALHHFRYRKHEVIVLHIMAEEELFFPFESFTEFIDLESPRQVDVDPKTIRASYLDRVRRFLKEISAGCGEISEDYVPMSTKTPFDKALSDFLARRHRSGK